jgi:hypothetical protein
MELPLLVITPLVTPIGCPMMFPSIVIMIMIVTAQSGRHPSPVPAPLLAMSCPTRRCAAVMPTLPATGIVELL